MRVEKIFFIRFKTFSLYTCICSLNIKAVNGVTNFTSKVACAKSTSRTL